MATCFLINIIYFFSVMIATVRCANVDVNFGENYFVTWGKDHVVLSQNGEDVQLSLYPDTGGAGFASNLDYGSGFFKMKMKIPDKNTSGVATTFYLTSHVEGNRDEIDFEFLGGTPAFLQTNVFATDSGGREQRIRLWFDPTTDFHTYSILWNQHQIVFFVDDIPIRVFKNNTGIGVNFPSRKMRVEASIWDAENWLGAVDWTQAPFHAHYQGFGIDGCPFQDSKPDQCYTSSNKLWWNGEEYWKLNPDQQSKYQNVRSNNVVYDYCTDVKRYPKLPPECQSNQ